MFSKIKKIVLLFFSLGLVIEGGSLSYLFFKLNLGPKDFPSIYQNQKTLVNQDYGYLAHPLFGYGVNLPPSDGPSHRYFFDAKLKKERLRALLEKNGTSDPFLDVGIFGGSVAFSIVGDLDSEKLARIFPAAKGRRVRIHNLALPGAKQPQTKAIFEFFVEALDVAIVLDGFNEFDVSTYPDRPFEWPHHSEELYSWSYPEEGLKQKINTLLGLSRLALEQLEASPWLARRGMVFLAWQQIEKSLAAKRAALTDQMINARKEAPPYAEDGYLSEKEITLTKVNLWKKYGRLQELAAKDANVLSFFILQPNQYVWDSKNFSVWEKENIFKASPTYVEQINLFYQEAREHIRRQRSQGRLFFDLSQAFVQNGETLYMDACCHFNARGNQALAAAVTKIIASVPINTAKK